MNIIGLSAFYHDSAVALLQEGQLTYAAQEERFSRIKHDASFPSLALLNSLQQKKLNLKDIDAFVFYEKPLLTLERLLETYLNYAPRGLSSFMKAFPLWSKEKVFQKRNIIKYLKKIDPTFNPTQKIFFCEHHTSHASSTYYSSPFEKAVVLTMDGVGEWATTSVHLAQDHQLQKKEEIHFPHSLGLFYSAMTDYAGFKVNSGEYKLMGLAPHGKPIFKELLLEKLFVLYDDGSYRLNTEYFDYPVGLNMCSAKMKTLLRFEKRAPQSPIRQVDKDLAASSQAVLEHVTLLMIKAIHSRYPLDHLCLAGGVALNCVLNSQIKKESPFKKIWIPPASGDAGGAIGAAYYYWHNELKNKKNINPLQSAYLGGAYTTEEIKSDLDLCCAVYSELEPPQLIEASALALANGQCMGWFQGSMEFGPRALGHRSILADPRNPQMQNILNQKIKFRESFRPFAPVVMKDKAKDWFDLDDSPFMLYVAKVNSSENAKKIPAVTHVDLTSRLQTLDDKTNPLLYQVIKKFDEITGIPMLINTSFNVRGEPIVASPQDAFRCFMGSDLDVLVIDRFILQKNQQIQQYDDDFHKTFALD